MWLGTFLADRSLRTDIVPGKSVSFLMAGISSCALVYVQWYTTSSEIWICSNKGPSFCAGTGGVTFRWSGRKLGITDYWLVSGRARQTSVTQPKCWVPPEKGQVTRICQSWVSMGSSVKWAEAQELIDFWLLGFMLDCGCHRQLTVSALKPAGTAVTWHAALCAPNLVRGLKQRLWIKGI